MYNEEMNLSVFRVYRAITYALGVMLLCVFACAPKPVTPRNFESDRIAKDQVFRCTLVLGLTVTAEWFEAGFESIVSDSRWEARTRPHTFVEDWANPDHEVWRAPIYSPCVDRPEKPDRVIVFVTNRNLSSASAWKAPLGRLINTLTQKFPEARRLELQTMIRGPRNQNCGDPKSIVSPFIDEALHEAAAARPGLVHVGPIIEAPSCDVFESGGPHFTVSGRSDIAIMVAKAYALP